MNSARPPASRIAPVGSTGTYAEYVATTEDAPLARIPEGLDPVVAAALPTAGMTGLSLVDSLAPLDGKTVLIVGASGGVKCSRSRSSTVYALARSGQLPCARLGRTIRFVRDDIEARLRST